MFNITTKSIKLGDKTLTLETGKIARQACGSVMASYGDTKILCTVVSEREAKKGIDFFPLTVIYQEKYFAAGRFPGGFFKREGKPSEREVLTSRLIDRTIRPLFPDDYYNETQIICTVLSYDTEAEADIVALIGASAAIAVSDIPSTETVAASRVGLIKGEFVLNPSRKTLADSDLDLVIASTKDSVMMVESEAQEISDHEMLSALKFGHQQLQPAIELINSLQREAGKEKRQLETEDHRELDQLIKNMVNDRVVEAFKITAKHERNEVLHSIKREVIEHFESNGYNPNLVAIRLKKLESQIVRKEIIEKGVRIDGRDTKTIRPIICEIGLLPKAHSSALFTRGETQALVVTTLGSSQDQQITDDLSVIEGRENFTLHYNFPPYSVGEAFPMRAPGRREVGHGKLAWKAINPVMPDSSEFPYAIRVVSEITESNGSSSMATVCGASLALMDAGVPITRPVAGIAMGLIKSDDKFIVLSDILGDEDHLGDMDFKVAASDKGITALQMDIKVKGINFDIVETAIYQARTGVAHILGIIKQTLEKPRNELSANAPVITEITLPQKKIKDLIGPGGKNIKEVCEVTGVKIDIEENGRVKIFANNKEKADLAIEIINDLTGNLTIGQIYLGKIYSITDFGVFITLPGKQNGLLRNSDIDKFLDEQYSSKIEQGNNLWVKVMNIDDRGKISLTVENISQEQ